jgi:hypothetical protein
VESASNLKIGSCTFQANFLSGTFSNLVSISSTNSTTSKITFDSCQFTGGGNGIALIGDSIKSVRVFNSGFNGQANVPAHLGSSQGFVGIGNYVDTNKQELFFGNNLNISLHTGNLLTNSGLFLGNFQLSPTLEFTITTTPLVLPLISNTGVYTNYEIVSGNNHRRGVIKISENLSSTQFDDEYIETSTSVNANLFANADSIIASVSSGSATFKFSNFRFI